MSGRDERKQISTTDPTIPIAFECTAIDADTFAVVAVGMESINLLRIVRVGCHGKTFCLPWTVPVSKVCDAVLWRHKNDAWILRHTFDTGNGPHLLELPLEPTVPWLVESTMLTCSQDTSGEHSAMNGESRHSNLKKRPGRPQLYDLDVQLNDIPVADSGSEDSHCKKKARGPKPKYVYSSAEQAAAARRQRNRKTALESYYRRREKIQNLEKEVSQLEQENKRLCQLLDEVNAGTATVHECADIDAYLEKTSD